MDKPYSANKGKFLILQIAAILMRQIIDTVSIFLEGAIQWYSVKNSIVLGNGAALQEFLSKRDCKKINAKAQKAAKTQ